jgi:hypothetical protein
LDGGKITQILGKMGMNSPHPSEEEEEHEWKNGSGRGKEKEKKDLGNLVPVGGSNRN